MIVVLPDPDSPTNAIILLGSSLREKSFITMSLGLVGYEKVTFLNSIPYSSLSRILDPDTNSGFFYLKLVTFSISL